MAQDAPGDLKFDIDAAVQLAVHELGVPGRVPSAAPASVYRDHGTYCWLLYGLQFHGRVAGAVVEYLTFRSLSISE